jgi:hypothetical protein
VSPRCVLAGVDGHRCNGRPQWHHPVKQQRIRRRFEYGAFFQESDGRWLPCSRTWPASECKAVGYRVKTLRQILGDERNRVWACWDAHQQIEGDVSNLPASVWEFAREFGLDAQLENDIARQRA